MIGRRQTRNLVMDKSNYCAKFCPSTSDLRLFAGFVGFAGFAGIYSGT
jgi:hypothetical protein